ncbi:Hypothetical predicted protein [Octopus vulgaris]|uniref:Tc1-like transposase DDE domain-containing protein n=1 Tax=Octopus vulgaris TaxID=6645 RepID=A0AA36FDD8_OCTVU|nr:Hypothetical predicted protein [Octopus vulgaris]
MHSKNPASVMVFGAVANDGKLMRLHFIEAVLKINTAEYLKILEVLLPWIRKHYEASGIMFVQDSATDHFSKRVQEFLKKELPVFVPKDIWPDSNPCEFWLWSAAEAISNITSHKCVSVLKASIKGAFSKMKKKK